MIVRLNCWCMYMVVGSRLRVYFLKTVNNMVRRYDIVVAQNVNVIFMRHDNAQSEAACHIVLCWEKS